MPHAELCVFGEVLFDHFPDGQSVLGGAPFNVAWHLQAFGQAPRFVSRVGRDPEGEEIRSAMARWGMTQAGLQTDEALPTGRVRVQLEQGQPSYEIVHPCAYDAIEADDSVTCGLLYHGSLALRSGQSRASLERLRQRSDAEVFLDVNLRAPWWQAEDLRDWMRAADWIKLNEDELSQLVPSPGGHTDDLSRVIEALELKGLIVTYGDKGAEMLAASGEHARVIPEQGAEVVDTVGAGDAFASVVILGLRQGWALQPLLERAQSFASAIVGYRGATVDDEALYQSFAQRWKLTEREG
jgi:fructokinase